jgi:hypothetical protein
MKDLDTNLIWEIYDKGKNNPNNLTPEKLLQNWEKFKQFIYTNFPEFDIEINDLDYWDDEDNNITKIYMEPITIYFDLPEHEKYYKPLIQVANNNPRLFMLAISNGGFQFWIKEQTFSANNLEGVYGWLTKIFTGIKAIN